jgi:cholesterol transport system auxiliary component
MMPNRRSWIASLTLAAAAVLLVAGCSLTRPSPVKATYLLEPKAPAAAARSQTGTLRMGTINVAAPFRGRSFVLRESGLRYESDFYNEFFVPPGVNIADATSRALTQSRVFTAVAPPGSGGDAEWVLDGFVGSLYGDGRDPAQPKAVLAITYYLSRGASGTITPFWSRNYERQVGFTAGDTNSYVEALNTALSEILADLARDLSSVSLPAGQ